MGKLFYRKCIFCRNTGKILFIKIRTYAWQLAGILIENSNKEMDFSQTLYIKLSFIDN